MAQAKKPSIELRDKENINPSLVRKNEAVDSDFHNIYEVLFDHAQKIDGFTGGNTGNKFYGFHSSLEILAGAYPDVEENSFAIIEGVTPQIAQFKNGEWINTGGRAAFVFLDNKFQRPDPGTVGTWYIVKDSNTASLWYAGKYHDFVMPDLSNYYTKEEINEDFTKNGGNKTDTGESLRLAINANETDISDLQDEVNSIEIPEIVDALNSTFVDKTLSANMGRVIMGFIDDINVFLNGDDVNLDQIKEIADYIKQNASDLENLTISNIAELPSALAGKEDKFSKNTAFNKNFGTGQNDVARGNHNHDSKYVNLNGDTMSGPLLIESSTTPVKTIINEGEIILQGASGGNNSFTIKQNGSNAPSILNSTITVILSANNADYTLNTNGILNATTGFSVDDGDGNSVLLDDGSTKLITDVGGVSKFPAEGLVSYWELNGNTRDSIGNNDAVTSGSVALNANGLLNGCYDFIDGHLTVPDSDDLTANAGNSDVAFCASMWVLPNSTSAEEWYLGKRAYSSTISLQGWQFYKYRNDLVISIFGVNGNEINARIENFSYSNTTEWKHLAFTYDGSGTKEGLKVYLNGVESQTLQSEIGSFNYANNDNSDLLIGNVGFSSIFNFEGKIDEVGLWKNKLLTQADINVLYNNGLGIQLNSEGIGSGTTSLTWPEIIGKPSTFPPSSHNHNYDKYDYWTIGAEGSYINVSSKEALNFVGSGATSVSRNGNTIVISSTDASGGGADGFSYVSSVSFIGGTLSINQSGASNQSKSLDGRWLKLSGGTLTGDLTAPKFLQGSLRKLKKNIKTYKASGLELINKLEIVDYNLKEDDSYAIGVVADVTHKDFLSEKQDSVDLYNTIFIQAKAIQELSKKVDEQEERLNKLEKLMR